MPKPIDQIAAEIFRIPPDAVDLAMTPEDIDSWDSLNHMRLITAIEAEYDIRLTMNQIQNIRSLADFLPVLPGQPSGAAVHSGTI